MQIHRYRGKSLRDALERARAVHGDEALVLSQENTPGGEVLVAISGQRPMPTIVAPDPTPAPGQVPQPQPPPVRGPGDVPARFPGGSGAGGTHTEPGRADVLRRLEAHGASREWGQAVADHVRASGARGAFAIDVAAAALATSIPIAPSPKADGTTHVLVFDGQPGSGKTTAVAKLAVKLVKARRRIGLVTLEARALGSARQIATYAKLLQVPCVAVRDADELRNWIANSASCDAVLIDASGRPERDAELLDGLDAHVERYCVLAADAPADELALSAAGSRADAAVITRLDLAEKPAAAVEAAARAGLPIAFLSGGREVGSGLRRATAEACSDLFLRGSLA